MKSLKTLWSKEERETLTRLYPMSARAELLLALPGRSASSVSNMARYMRLTRHEKASRGVAPCVCCHELRAVRRAGLRFAGYCADCYQSALAGELYYSESEEIPSPKKDIKPIAEKDIPSEIRDLISVERNILKLMGKRSSVSC